MTSAVDFCLTTSAHGGWNVVAAAGEIDVGTAGQLREAVLALTEQEVPRVVVDLAQVSFMDSTGLGALVGCLRQVNARGGELRLAAATPRVVKVFEITDLTRVLPLYPSLDEAVAAAPR